MPRAQRARQASAADRVLDATDSSLLDLLDHVLNKGVMASGDVMLGVAGVDLVYLRLSTLLCAADRVLPADPARKNVARHRRRPPRLRR
jgi:hypothetical protein